MTQSQVVEELKVILQNSNIGANFGNAEFFKTSIEDLITKLESETSDSGEVSSDVSDETQTLTPASTGASTDPSQEEVK